jgi:hypothetical protein
MASCEAFPRAQFSRCTTARASFAASLVAYARWSDCFSWQSLQVHRGCLVRWMTWKVSHA